MEEESEIKETEVKLSEYRVCRDIYPAGFSYNKVDGFYLEPVLKSQLDILLKNIKNDWDFTLLITGGGETRVGKSLLGLQICAYWTYMVKKLYGKKCPFSCKDNIVFDGKKLIEIGNKLGASHPYSCLIYDEAGADLAGVKIMSQMTQDVLDYYRECGQFNLLNVLILPEFFDLPKSIAMSRSIFLIDVTYNADENGYFQRGYFKFYSRRNKKKLYLMGKKELNYQAYICDFKGRFHHFYPIDEAEYRQAKLDALKRRESKRRNKFQLQRDACWYLLANEYGLSYTDIGKRMEQLTGQFVSKSTIHDGVMHYKVENEDMTDDDEDADK